MKRKYNILPFILIGTFAYPSGAIVSTVYDTGLEQLTDDGNILNLIGRDITFGNDGATSSENSKAEPLGNISSNNPGLTLPSGNPTRAIFTGDRDDDMGDTDNADDKNDENTSNSCYDKELDNVSNATKDKDKHKDNHKEDDEDDEDDDNEDEEDDDTDDINDKEEDNDSDVEGDDEDDVSALYDMLYTDDPTISFNGWAKSPAIKNDDETRTVRFTEKKLFLNTSDLIKINFQGGMTAREISWGSSNPAVAQVDANGFVYAVAPGKAKITALFNGKKVSLPVKVNKKSYSALEAMEIFIKGGKSAKVPLIYGSKPSSVSCDDTTAISIKSHKLKAIEKDIDTDVSLTLNYGKEAKEMMCFVENPEGDENKDDETELGIGQTYALAVDGAVRVPVFKSANPKIATVDNYGVVTAISPGHTVISAKVGSKKVKFYIGVNETHPEYKVDEDKALYSLRLSRFVSLTMYKSGNYYLVQDESYLDDGIRTGVSID